VYRLHSRSSKGCGAQYATGELQGKALLTRLRGRDREQGVRLPLR
jgi:hypothetical protein